MAKFNFLTHRAQPTDIKPRVRTRATGRDAYAGLRGHAYIAARGLGWAQKVQTPAQTGDQHD